MENLLRVLNRAIEGNLRLRIMYESDGVFSERTIKPENMQDGKVRAYCYMRKRKRTFVVSKILAANIVFEKEKG